MLVNKSAYHQDDSLEDESTVVFQHGPASEDGELYLIPFKYKMMDDIANDEIRINKVLVPLEKGKLDFGSRGTVEILSVNDRDDKTAIKATSTGDFAAYGFYFVGEDENEKYCISYEKDEKILGVLDVEKTYVFDKLDRNKNYYIIGTPDSMEILYDKMIKLK